MSFIYAVLGGGRQGTAAAYDMAKFGDARQVRIADLNLEVAQKSAARVNALLGQDIATAHQVDVTDHDQLIAFLEPVDSFLSAVPYWYNPAITQAAIQARACMTDLGGNTDLVREQMKLDAHAQAAGIAIIPDCGQVPGMGTSLCVYAMSLLDETEEIMMWDGGNPVHPRPPFNYILTFNIAGLTNEYDGVPISSARAGAFRCRLSRMRITNWSSSHPRLALWKLLSPAAAPPRCHGLLRDGSRPCGTRPCAGPVTLPSGRLI